jgi:DNA-binding transcriptional MocR family regulator
MHEPAPFQAAGRLIDFMRQADQPGLINLAAGVPGLDALPRAELEEAFRRGFALDGSAMLAYHHPEGDHELRELLAARLRARGAAVEASGVITVTGCTQALQLMLTVLVKSGDIVACEAPAYYGMLELLSAAGVRVLPLPVRGETGIDAEEAERLLERWKPRCLVVCSTLSNPSGATLPDGTRRRLVEICRRTGTRIIDDDIYADLLEGGAPAPLARWDEARDVVSYVSSYCKSVAPGLRVGVCVPEPALHEEVATLKCRQDLHSAVVSEVALREFFKMGAMEPHLAGLRARNRRRREIGIAAVEASFPEGTQLVQPRGGYMLWAELPGLVDFPALHAAARARGIAFAAGTVFFPTAAERSCVRLNCAKATEEQLASGIATLGELLCEELEPATAEAQV